MLLGSRTWPGALRIARAVRTFPAVLCGATGCANLRFLNLRQRSHKSRSTSVSREKAWKGAGEYVSHRDDKLVYSTYMSSLWCCREFKATTLQLKRRDTVRLESADHLFGPTSNLSQRTYPSQGASCSHPGTRHLSPPLQPWRDCYSAAPTSPSGRCFNIYAEGKAAK